MLEVTLLFAYDGVIGVLTTEGGAGRSTVDLSIIGVIEMISQCARMSVDFTAAFRYIPEILWRGHLKWT